MKKPMLVLFIVILVGISTQAQEHVISYVKVYQGPDITEEGDVNWTIEQKDNSWLLKKDGKNNTFVVYKREIYNNGVNLDYLSFRGADYRLNWIEGNNEFTLMPFGALTDWSQRIFVMTTKYTIKTKYFKRVKAN